VRKEKDRIWQIWPCFWLVQIAEVSTSQAKTKKSAAAAAESFEMEPSDVRRI